MKIAGMVSSCAACNAMPFWAAYVTGAGAGFTFFCLRALVNHLHSNSINLQVSSIQDTFFNYFILQFLVDDPLDAFAVHFGGGFFGMISAPLVFDQGVFIIGDANSAQVRIQLNLKNQMLRLND